MKQIILLFSCILMFSFSLLGCVQSKQLADPGLTDITLDEPTTTPTQIVSPPTISPNVTPTFTPKEQAAVDEALAAFGDKADNMMIRMVTGASPGKGYVVRLQQTYHGIPIAQAYSRVLTEPGQPADVNEAYFDNVSLPSITPTISVDEALAISIEALGVEGDYIFQEPSNLIIEPMFIPGQKNPTFILLRNIVIESNCPIGTWVVQVNAHTGKVQGLSGRTGFDLPVPSPCPTPARIPSYP